MNGSPDITILLKNCLDVYDVVNVPCSRNSTIATVKKQLLELKDDESFSAPDASIHLLCRGRLLNDAETVQKLAAGMGPVTCLELSFLAERPSIRRRGTFSAPPPIFHDPLCPNSELVTHLYSNYTHPTGGVDNNNVNIADPAHNAAPRVGAFVGAVPPAGVAAAPAPAPAPAGEVLLDEDGAAIDPPRQGIYRYIDIRLLLRIAIMFLMFAPDLPPDRLYILIGVAAVVYLFQVGLIGRRGQGAAADGVDADPEAHAERVEAALAAGDDAAVAALLNAHANNNVNGNANANVGEQDGIPAEDVNGDADSDNGVVGGAADGEVGDFGDGDEAPAEYLIEVEEASLVTYAERFIVGFVCSLMPSWQPRPVPVLVPEVN